MQSRWTKLRSARLLRRLWLVANGLSLLLGSATAAPVSVGSKKFTESVVLAEILTQLAGKAGADVRHRAELGGTAILWNALRSGDIDAYPEYTGTLREMLVAKGNLRQRLAEEGIEMSESLGFNDSYAIGVRSETERRLGLKSLSDLARHPELRLGFSSEFLQRADGWPKVKRVYGFQQAQPTGLDHEIAYRALESGDIDAVDLYSTDAEIRYYDLKVLADDRKVFPRYDAVIVFRHDLRQREPRLVQAIERLRDRIHEPEMIEMNERAKIDHVAPEVVAADFLRTSFGIESRTETVTLISRLRARLGEHLRLVGVSMAAAIALGLPLGMLAAALPRFGALLLMMIGVIQTFPALALLVILIRPLKALGFAGIGDTPAIVALFLYSLLPIVRNTHAGLRGIAIAIRESAEALALPFHTRWLRIDLPLALPVILAGVQTAAVVNVGFATLGALVGAGGFGQPILAGIRLDDYALILEGAIPAAALAVLTQILFEILERTLVPRGIRGS